MLHFVFVFYLGFRVMFHCCPARLTPIVSLFISCQFDLASHLPCCLLRGEEMLLHTTLYALITALSLAEGVLAKDRCRALADLRGVNRRLFRYSPITYYMGEEYFCADSAPEQLQCRCGISTTCMEKDDPWGQNIGVCGCCPWWLILFFVFFGIVFFTAMALVLYMWFCRGKWWCDGYPLPVQPVMSRRGPPIVARPSAPLPPNLFRTYRASDFVSGAPQQQQLENEGGVLRGGHRGTGQQQQQQQQQLENEGGVLRGGHREAGQQQQQQQLEHEQQEQRQQQRYALQRENGQVRLSGRANFSQAMGSRGASDV